MDIIGPFVNVFDTYLIAPLVRRMRILRSYSASFSGMETEVGKLTARRIDEENNLKTAEDAGQVKTEQASNWFKKVKAIEEEADDIRNEHNQGKCAGGWCVNCWSRYRSSKRSIDLKQKAESVFNDQFDLARPPPLKRGIEKETEPIQNQPSTQHMLQQLLDLMVEPKIEILGLYGMGGVGKTTLAKQVNNHFLNSSCFEKVIMVTVSATPDIPSIRITIGKRLELDLSNATEDDEREMLYDALKRKKFLLILDDVWDKHTVELEDVGIPHPRNHKGSKILITSRSQDACTDMGARETIKVRPLSKVESWNLFVQEAGDHVVVDGIRCFAEKIVERCEGLPLAIVTVAHAMTNRHGVGEWANAEREMKESVTEIRGMKEKVLVLLKFSFDRLEDDILRSLFLYCACCFPEDHNIGEEDILDYCIGEGVVDTLGSLIATRNKCEALIGSLKIACMLEDGEYGGCVRMHDMMRELGLWITSTSKSDGSPPKFLLRTGKSCEEAPQPKEWVDATKISLINTQIKEFPELGERCGKLTTLLFRKNWILSVIPTNFFQHMDHLSVLDLSYSYNLEYLPDSLSFLENLRVLRLRACTNLKVLPALGRLRRLQVLDLYHCIKLDQQIFGSECVGVVSNLRYLELQHSKVSIPTGVISRLVEVEELRLYGANIKWSVKAENEINEERRSVLSSDEEGHDLQVSSSSSSINEFIDVGELSNLTRLRSLEISFDGIIISDWFKPLTKKITWLELKNCRFKKQDVIRAINESRCLHTLNFYSCTSLTCVPTLFKGTYLMINECEELEKLLDGAEAYQDSFQRLEELILIRLPKLKRICVGLAPLNCFAQLSDLIIEDCNRLKMVFTKEMPRHFNNLTGIHVSHCNEMEIIIETIEEEGFVMEGSSNNGRVISPFPKLETLSLLNLPALGDVCNNHILQCPLIKRVEVWKCPGLNKNPLHICNTDGLFVIEDEVNGQWEGEVLEEEIQEIK